MPMGRRSYREEVAHYPHRNASDILHVGRVSSPIATGESLFAERRSYSREVAPLSLRDGSGVVPARYFYLPHSGIVIHNDH